MIGEDGIDRCRNGHRWTEEDTIYESGGAGKPRRRRCRKCVRDKARRRNRRRELDELAGLGRVGRALRHVPEEIERPGAYDMRKSFDAALDEVTNRNCYGNEEQWVDYSEEQIPSRQQAMLMCTGCPLFDICRDYANETTPGWGVWGGEVWIYERKL